MKTRTSLISILMLVAVALPGFSQPRKASGESKSQSSDLQLMTRARNYFSKAQLDLAYAEYEKVPKSSDYWLEAIEEKAHVMGRKKEYAKALSLLQTPMSSAFVGLTGPEPYFVAALTHLKICDYSSIFKVSKLFKERFLARSTSLESLAKNGESDAVNEMLKRIQTAPLSFQTLGALVKDLPRNLQRDRILFGLSAKKSSSSRDAAIKNRLKQLAKVDLKEIEDTLNKLQILEAEVIQRIHLADKNNAKREKQGQFADGKNVLNFPYSGEVWLDELDNYAARVEKCSESPKRAAL